MTDSPDLGNLPPPPWPRDNSAESEYLPEVNWSYSKVVLALLVGIFIGPFIGAIGYAVLSPGTSVEEVPTTLLLVAQVLASFGVVLFFSLRNGTGSWRRDFGFVLEPRHVAWIAGGMVLQIAVALVTFPLVERFAEDDGPQQEIARLATEMSGAELALFAVLVAVLTPIFEEIVFRGMLLGRLVKRFNKHWSAVISGAAFAAVHLADPNAVLVVPGLFMVGVALAYAAYRSRNLSIPIFIHIGVNGLAVLLLAFADEIEANLESWAGFVGAFL